MPLSPGVLQRMCIDDYSYAQQLTIHDLDWLRNYQCIRQARELHAIMHRDGITLRSDDGKGRKLAHVIAPLVSDIATAGTLYVPGFPEWSKASPTVLAAYASVRLTEWSCTLAHYHRGSDHGPFCDTCVSLANCLTVASMVDSTRHDLFKAMVGVQGETVRYSFAHVGHRIIARSPLGPVWSVKCVTCGTVSSVEIYEYVAAGRLAIKHQGQHMLPTS